MTADLTDFGVRVRGGDKASPLSGTRGVLGFHPGRVPPAGGPAEASGARMWRGAGRRSYPGEPSRTLGAFVTNYFAETWGAWCPKSAEHASGRPNPRRFSSEKSVSVQRVPRSAEAHRPRLPQRNHAPAMAT